MLQDLEFYKSQSMLDDFEINRLRCELKATMDKVEQERANSWAIILGLASGAVGLASGPLAASAMAVETAALGAAVGSTAAMTSMFGTTAAAASTAAATASAASASMIGTGAAVSVAAETAAAGAALSCVIS